MDKQAGRRALLKGFLALPLIGLMSSNLAKADQIPKVYFQETFHIHSAKCLESYREAEFINCTFVVSGPKLTFSDLHLSQCKNFTGCTFVLQPTLN